jgi:hypothetical protein
MKSKTIPKKEFPSLATGLEKYPKIKAKYDLYSERYHMAKGPAKAQTNGVINSRGAYINWVENTNKDYSIVAYFMGKKEHENLLASVNSLLEELPKIDNMTPTIMRIIDGLVLFKDNDFLLALVNFADENIIALSPNQPNPRHPEDEPYKHDSNYKFASHTLEKIWHLAIKAGIAPEDRGAPLPESLLTDVKKKV